MILLLLVEEVAVEQLLQLTIGSEAENNNSKDGLGATKRKHKVHHFDDKRLIKLIKEFE